MKTDKSLGIHALPSCLLSCLTIELNSNVFSRINQFNYFVVVFDSSYIYFKLRNEN